MGRFYLSAVLFSVLIIISVCEPISSELVPVVFWNIESDKPVHALQHVGKKNFREIVTGLMKEQPFLIVFQDENLSPEDFTSRDTSGVHVFEALNKMIKEQTKDKKYYLPSVQSPKSVFLELAKVEQPLAATAIQSGEVSLPKPTPGGIVVIHLDEANDDDDRPHLIKRHVQFMVETFTEIHNAYPNTIAAYTAERPSWSVPTMGLSRKSRHLLEADTGNTKAITTAQQYSDDNVRIYFDSIPYFVKNNQETLLSDLAVTSSRNETDIDVKATNVNGTFIMKFTNSSGYWHLKTVVLDDEELRVKDVAAPFGFSYHCNTLQFKNRNSTTILSFPRVQFEPNYSVISNMKFGDAYDCVGFTSIPIWSGLFVTLILAAIMTLGLTMMMDIKTMDRFDDPKGKGITINVVE